MYENRINYEKKCYLFTSWQYKIKKLCQLRDCNNNLRYDLGPGILVPHTNINSKFKS